MSLDNLPLSWASTKLVDVCEIILGQSPEGTTVNQNKQGIVFYQGKTEFGKLHPTPRNYCTAPKKIAKKNDILLSVRAPVGPTNLANETTAIGRGLAAIRSPSDIGFSYLLYYFKYLEPWLSQQGTGTTFKAISGEFIRNLDFLVPTEAEQQEIVRQLDIMLAQVEQIKARLDAIPAILKKFRQSVLADAVSGELINQGFNQLSVESLSDYLTDVRYGTSKKCSESLIDAVPVLRIPNIADDGTIDFTNLKYAEFESKEIKQLQLSKGDLLLIRSNGSLDLVGKSAIADELDKVVLYAGYLIRLRFNDSVNPQFIQYFLQAPQTRQTIENIARSTSGVNNINSKEIASLKIQLPCIDHQNEVVLRVKQLLELRKRIEETIKSAQKRVNFLTQSILAKAFSGELTAEWREQHQDLITGVNSAESLLAKIQAEREASKLVKKAKKVK